jgi:hypothetical protein
MEGLIQIGPYDGQLAGRVGPQLQAGKNWDSGLCLSYRLRQGNFLKKLLPVDQEIRE